MSGTTQTLLKRLHVLDGLHQSGQRVFRIAIEHASHGLEKQRVLKARKAFALAALQNYYRLRPIDFQNRHAGNRTVGIVARVGVYHIIRAYDEFKTRQAGPQLSLLETPATGQEAKEVSNGKNGKSESASPPLSEPHVVEPRVRD